MDVSASDQPVVASSGDEQSVVVTLGPNVSVRPVAAADVTVTSPRGELPLGTLPPAIAAVLRELGHGMRVDRLEDALLSKHGPEALAHWYAVAARLEAEACLRYVVRQRGQVAAAYVPASEGTGSTFIRVMGPVRLSRFAHVRRDGDALIVDSPLSRGRVELFDPRLAAVVAAMHAPVTPAAIRQRLNLADGDSLDPLLSLLVAAQIILSVDEDGTTAEDRSDAARCWEFADLVLHGRSRTSRTDLRVGGTYRFRRELESGPPVKPRMSLTRISLARPDLAALVREDVPFTRVLEQRRSVRRHGDPPLSVTQLGEFLYRVARVGAQRDGHARIEGTVADADLTSFRVYPGGGARYPLEVYPVVGRCDGLDAGLYHYDPERHELEILPQHVGGIERLLRTSSVPMDDGGVPQLVFVLTARFRRLSWKYEGNAYALLLQEVGAVYQTMYLVATAMGLAPCAVGGGDAARFAHIIDTDPLDEASVGAFVLGTTAPSVR